MTWSEKLDQAADAGISEEEFWRLTPRAYHRRIRAENRMRLRKREEMIEMAWMTAVLLGAAQAGKLKPLKAYLETSEPKKLTGEEVMATLRAMKSRMEERTVEEWRDKQ